MGTVLVLLGAGLIVAGADLSGVSAYGQSVFVNAGTAVGLTGPLFLVERAFSRRIRRVSRTLDLVQTSATEAQQAGEAARTSNERLRDEVAALRTEFQKAMVTERARLNDLRSSAALGSFDALFELYETAAQNHSIDRLGLRVAIEALDLAIRVRARSIAPEGAVERVIELSCEDDELAILSDAVWSEGEPAVQVFQRLATGLMDRGRYPGDAAFDLPNLLGTITDGLQRVIEIRRGPAGDPQVRQIIEVVNESFAVTREGLDSLQVETVWAERDELVGNSNRAFARLEKQSQLLGVRQTNFTTAFALAEKIHTSLHLRRPDRS